MMATDIEKLISQLYEDKFTKKFSEEDILRIINQDNVYPFFYLDGGRIIGLTTLYTVELFSRKLGVIEEVVSLREYRNKGIGSSLMHRAINKAKELGLTCLELNVKNTKPKVKKFYENMGFYDRKNNALRMWINKQ